MTITIHEIMKEECKGKVSLALTLLQVQHVHALPLRIEVTDNSYCLQVDTQMTVPFEAIIRLPLEEQLRYLINIGQLYGAFDNTVYTYALTPDNVVFTQDGIAKVCYRGIKGQVPPYEMLNEEAFLKAYQALMISVLDTKTDFESLLQGKLNFYKGHPFCEHLLETITVSEAMALLQEQFDYEKERVHKEMIRLPQRQVFLWKLVGMLSSALFMVLVFIFGYSLLVTQPQQQKISDLRLAFIQKDYSKVVSGAKDMDSKQLSIEDKYIVAYAVIMTESLTDTQKNTLSKITTQTNEDYLRYWVLIGQHKIDDAMDVASFLNDPQLVMYSLTKKIDDVQRDANLTSEKRNELINRYKGQLEELKKQYLPTQTPKKN